MKVLLDASNDRILGFTMLGPGAGEVIAVVQTAMLAGLPYTALRDAIFTHPTKAEGLNVQFATALAGKRSQVRVTGIETASPPTVTPAT